MPRNAVEIGGDRFYACPAHPEARPYVSVTTALKLGAKPYYPVGSADHGIAMHAAFELLVSGADWRNVEGYEITPAMEAGMAQLERWWPHSGLEALLIERTVYHHVLGYAGTLDALVRDREGTTYVLDLKTQRDPDPAKWRLQMAAYGYAHDWADEDDNLTPMPRGITKGLVLWVPKENPHLWQPRVLDIGLETQAAWLSALHTHRFLADTDASDGELLTVWSLGGSAA